MIATNIFVKKNKLWRMVHHHGSQEAKGSENNGSQQPTIISIDATSLLDGSRSPNNALDEFVEAVLGALQDSSAASDSVQNDYSLVNGCVF
jgi:hypothetical protein